MKPASRCSGIGARSNCALYPFFIDFGHQPPPPPRARLLRRTSSLYPFSQIGSIPGWRLAELVFYASLVYGLVTLHWLVSVPRALDVAQDLDDFKMRHEPLESFT